MAAEGYPDREDEGQGTALRRRRFARAESESDTYDDFVSDGDEGPGGRFSAVRILVAVLALVAFAAVTWYAYNWGIASREPQELVVIQAEATPEKERPAEEGGMEVPHQDKLLLNDVAPDSPQPKIERLLPPPETPKPPVVETPAVVPPPAVTTADVAESSNAVAESEAVTGSSSKTAEQTQQVAEAAAAGAPANEAQQSPVRSLVVRERSDDAAESGAVPSPSAGSAEPAEASQPAKAEPKAASAAATEPTVPKAPAITEAPAKPKAPATPQVAKAPAAGSYFLQLASVKSAAAAAREWQRLQNQFPSLLGRQQLTVEQAEVKGTNYHRVQAGAFATRNDAAALCSKLKAGGQDCLVRKR